MDFDENYKSLYTADEESKMSHNADQHKIIRKVNDVVIDFDSSKTKAKKKSNSQSFVADEFIFGSKSAQMYEEYSVIKTNRHNQSQNRVLVIDGSKIYHKKQMFDAKTGEVAKPQNNISHMRVTELQSEQEEMSAKKKKRVSFLKAKLTNFISKSTSIKNNVVRQVQQIIQIEQLLEGEQRKASNKFYIDYRASGQQSQEEIADRKVLYECENVETAAYIVAKIKTQM